jgi:hypothetical protein
MGYKGRDKCGQVLPAPLELALHIKCKLKCDQHMPHPGIRLLTVSQRRSPHGYGLEQITDQELL